MSTKSYTFLSHWGGLGESYGGEGQKGMGGKLADICGPWTKRWGEKEGGEGH